MSTANYHELTNTAAEKKGKHVVSSTTILWVTYLNVALYALSYQLQTPVEPFLIKKLSEEAGDSEGINQTYGNLQSFFQTVQMLGSPLIGLALDRFGIRFTSILVYLSSACSYAILSSARDLPTLFLSKIPTIFQAAFLVAQATAAASTGNDVSARAAALGRMTTAYTVGATLGPTVGGFLADRGNFYVGAKLAVVGSLISALISLLYLPTGRTSSDEHDKEVSSEGKSLLQSVRDSGSMAMRASLWPLLMVKVLGGVVASMHSTSMPLVLTQELNVEPSQLGMTISGSMMAVAIFGAVGMAPLTRILGAPRMTYVGLVGRAALGLSMAFLISVAIGNDDVFLIQIMAVAIGHAIFTHTLATGLTTQTTGAVASEERGALLGLEHSLFSLARIGGPKIATLLLSAGKGL